MTAARPDMFDRRYLVDRSKRGSACVPTPVYGVIVIVVVLLCLVVLVRQGLSTASATEAIATSALAAVGFTRRLLCIPRTDPELLRHDGD